MNRPEPSSPIPDNRYLSTTEVARAVGVSVTTVKRWVDEGKLKASRTLGKHRKILLTEFLRFARDENLPQCDLTSLDPRIQPDSIRETDPLRANLLAALRAGDEKLARGLIHGSYLSGLKIETLADEVLSPVMVRIGEDWHDGGMEVHHEHRASQILSACLFELRTLLEDHADVDRPVAVGGAPERDYYQLATLLAQMVLLDAGWQAINLGPHTPMQSFRKALLEYQPRLMWVSASHLPDPEQFLAEYSQFYQTADQRNVAVVIGGRGISAELRRRMHYTSFGDGLTHLADFARKLHPRGNG